MLLVRTFAGSWSSNCEYNPCMEIPWQRAGKVGRAYLWSILLWGWFGPLMAAQEKMRALADGTDVPFSKLLLIAGAWCMTAALLAPPVFYMVRRYPIARPFQLRRIGGYILGAVPYLVLSVCIRSALLPPDDPAMPGYFSRFFEGIRDNAPLFALQTWDYTVVVVASHAFEYFMRARNQELERAKLQQALAESELQSLKSQLQPHFLFNTLHGISALIEVDKTRAKLVVLKLSNLLRAAIQDGTSDLISLDDELKFAREYLDIEKMRLEERLEVKWKIEPGTGRFLVPSLILQPLVENAVVHGVACSREGGWIEISARRAGERLELNVENSVRGKGAAGSGLGLHNTKARLSHLYADEASFRFAVTQDGIASATLLVPVLGITGVEDTENSDVLQIKNI
jgi:two-component system, LytTR family, sensor kinase